MRACIIQIVIFRSDHGEGSFCLIPERCVFFRKYCSAHNFKCQFFRRANIVFNIHQTYHFLTSEHHHALKRGEQAWTPAWSCQPLASALPFSCTSAAVPHQSDHASAIPAMQSKDTSFLAAPYQCINIFERISPLPACYQLHTSSIIPVCYQWCNTIQLPVL